MPTRAASGVIGTMMNNGSSPFGRYIPLACWLAVVLGAIFICLKIIGYGYLPSGDLRRHVAKPFAGKPYSEIVVMRPEYVVDHSPGWEWLLGALHRSFGWDEDALASFSITSLLLCIFCLPLFWLRRPEAWFAALLAELIALPELMSRITQARPFLLTEGLLIAFLFAWSKEDGKNPPRLKIVLTWLGMAASAWIHGSWYLWVLLPAAFFLARRWRTGLWLVACWLGGTVAGALLAPKPIAFLYETVFMATSVWQEHLPKWMLVGEFQPSEGEFATLVLLALVYLWRQSSNKIIRPLFHEPVFWMIVIGWICGLFADRFWADWGMPAALVWMALQFDDTLPAIAPAESCKRLAICAMIVVPLVLDATNDLGRRYSASLNQTFVHANDEHLKGWMPEKGGIFYSDSMKFFYNTFYANPAGDWRYIVGFEPALMPTNDLAVYRDIQRARGADKAFKPWVDKMRTEDRLAVERPAAPDLPPLEWIRTGDVWIGRLPQKSVHVR